MKVQLQKEQKEFNMSVQSSIFKIETSLIFPSTKTIPTKQHMAVWVRSDNGLEGVWSQINVRDYDLVNNSAVITSSEVLTGYGMLELRVADTPDELGIDPTNIAIVAGNIIEVVICARNIGIIEDVAQNMDAVTGLYENIDDVISCGENINAIIAAPQEAINAANSATESNSHATDAANSATESAESVWDSQAKAMTSDSFANEGENVLVKEWTSNGDGTFTSTDIPNTYSSFHWSIMSAMYALGLSFQDTWDATTGVYPTTRPPEGTGLPLEAGDLFIVDVAGTIDSTQYYIGDWMVLNSSLVWTRIAKIVDWNSIQDIPNNVINAITDVELQAGLGASPRGISIGDSQDPNINADEYIVTNHANTPNSYYHWYIRTQFFYTTENNRTQIALSYNSPIPRVYTRQNYETVPGTPEWTPWAQMGTMTWDGTTLAITL